jgi:AmmeMemoRadiSam system protein B
MAWSYTSICESPIPDVYIIISANHNDQEEGLSSQVFMTPLGFIPTDVELAKSIEVQGVIDINERAHDMDHGIEVQLPFLQHAKYDSIERLKILPIIINETTNLEKLADAIKKSLRVLNRKAVVIASTDLTRYGPIFHFVPFTTQIESRIYELDDELLEFIKKKDVNGYASFLDKTFDTKSGLRAIELLLRIIDPSAVRVLRHYTSGDITGDYKNSVSYAAVVFEKI